MIKYVGDDEYLYLYITAADPRSSRFKHCRKNNNEELSQLVMCLTQYALGRDHGEVKKIIVFNMISNIDVKS